MYCDEKGIKYVHAVECYLTEDLKNKVRDNYHTILIAKNYQGLLEINKIISQSCDSEHFYYVNRLSFDEFIHLSKNVITTSACMASPLNRLPIDHPRYTDLVKRYDFLEIQYHEHPEQKNFNIHLATLAQEYQKPLIAGTDTHSLNKYKAECRKILLKRKHKSYGDEDAFDLTYKTYDELIEAFRIQDALPEKVYMQAIENANILEEMIENFEIDTSIKYPILYGTREKDKEVFYQTIQSKFEKKIESGIIPPEQIEKFKQAIEEEKRVFNKVEMDGFMLSMSELTSWCHENGIPLGPCRGSVGGSRVAYTTDITDLNPETWNTVFSRFCNEDRKEIGDIDIDCIEADRPKIFSYIVSRFGKDKTARVSAFGTIAEKGTIDDIGGALRDYWKEKNSDSRDADNPYSIPIIEKIKNEFVADEEKTKKAHPDIFYYYDGLLGTKISQSIHPAGMVISPITLNDHYGVFEKDNDMCLMLDMEEIHEIGLAKYDFLILKNIEIIQKTYKMLGEPYPLSHEIDWNDQAVFKDMLKSPVGIFQFESDYGFTLLKKFEPHSIFDMSLVTAALRPSGASYREQLMKRERFKNPSSIIDELLKDNNGFLIYQEDTIKFLQEICGLTGSEADNVRRAIGRKDEERLNKALPQILEGYCNKSEKPREVAEKEAQIFLQIIKDSAAYQFGYNHSIGYCMIGYMCAYLRYYHPYEFIITYLNCAANEDDVVNGTTLAQEYGIKIIPPRFRFSRASYEYDPEAKIISKGIASIKYLNASVAEELYTLRNNQYGCFMELLQDVVKTSIDIRQLDILIKLDYFQEFGNSRELTFIYEDFEMLKRGNAKELSKDNPNEEYHKMIAPYVYGKRKDGSDAKSYKITDMQGLMCVLENQIRSMHHEDYDLKTKMKHQLDTLGSVDLVTNKEEDRNKLYITDVKDLKSDGGCWGRAIFYKSIGSGKSFRMTVKSEVFDKKRFKAGDIILANSVSKNKTGWWYLWDYDIL